MMALMMASCATSKYIYKYPPYADHFPPLKAHEGHIHTDSSMYYQNEPFIYKGDTLISAGMHKATQEQNCFHIEDGQIIQCGGRSEMCDSVRMYQGKIYEYQKDRTIISW